MLNELYRVTRYGKTKGNFYNSKTLYFLAFLFCILDGIVTSHSSFLPEQDQHMFVIKSTTADNSFF